MPVLNRAKPCMPVSYSPINRSWQAQIQETLHSTGAQAKLTIGQPNDKYEQEADHVADQVMRMSDADVAQRVETGTVQPMRIQRMCEGCEEEMAQRQSAEEEEETLQAKEMPGQTPKVTPDLESRINSLRSGGQPLAPATRSFFEPRFGHDFSHVRTHTDSNASEIAKSVKARAFTLGGNIVFGSDEYQPQSKESKYLLGHELTHVVQQGQRARNTQVRRFPTTDPTIWGEGRRVRQQGEQEERGQRTNGCVPAAGITKSSCTAYFSNAWWLPLAYANNTTCACQTTPNSPTANCVRKFLQDRLAATPRSVKRTALLWKPGNPPEK